MVLKHQQQRLLGSLLSQELFGSDAGLSKDSLQRAFGHIAWMVRNCSVAARDRVKPDFMAARRLTVELKAH